VIERRGTGALVCGAGRAGAPSGASPISSRRFDARNRAPPPLPLPRAPVPLHGGVRFVRVSASGARRVRLAAEGSAGLTVRFSLSAVSRGARGGLDMARMGPVRRPLRSTGVHHDSTGPVPIRRAQLSPSVSRGRRADCACTRATSRRLPGAGWAPLSAGVGGALIQASERRAELGGHRRERQRDRPRRQGCPSRSDRSRLQVTP
jgi:hypothetical protein